MLSLYLSCFPEGEVRRGCAKDCSKMYLVVMGVPVSVLSSHIPGTGAGPGSGCWSHGFSSEIGETCVLFALCSSVCVDENCPGNGRRLETLCVPPGPPVRGLGLLPSRTVSPPRGQWRWSARRALHKPFGVKPFI